MEERTQGVQCPYPVDSEQWSAWRLGYTDREESLPAEFTVGRTWRGRPDLNEAYDEGVNAAEKDHQYKEPAAPQWTPERLAPSTRLCGCLLEPISDNKPCDLCSEATGLNDGRGWRIVLCPKHAAAPELYAALADLIAQHNGESVEQRIRRVDAARAALAKAEGVLITTC